MTPRLLLALGMLLCLRAEASVENCLRFNSESKLIEALEQLVPLETKLQDAREAVQKRCSTANVSQHIYEDGPLKYSKNGDILYVYSWLRVSEGPYRFVRGLFLETHTEATVLFGEEGRAVGYEAKFYIDSL